MTEQSTSDAVPTFVASQSADHRETELSAVAALILGILGWTFLPFVGSIAAIVVGHTARRKIAAAPRSRYERELAFAGVFLGYLQVVLVAVVVVLLAGTGLVKSTLDRRECSNDLARLEDALASYHREVHAYPIALDRMGRHLQTVPDFYDFKKNNDGQIRIYSTSPKCGDP